MGEPAALSRTFGVAVAAVGDGVVATLALAPGEAAEPAIALLGQYAVAAGAARLADGPVRTIETSCRYLAEVAGDVLRAEARPLGGDGAMQTWRASVHRGFGSFRPTPENRTAEVTQSLLAISLEPRPTPVAVAEETPAGATADVRRRQIFRAACEVIARKGYDKASVREIAAAAGLPIATLYLYVRNKEDILHMITQGLMEDIFRDFRENLSAEGQASEKLTRAIGSYLRYVDRNRKYINLVYRETRSLSRENREKIFAIERDFARLWHEILEDGVEAGEFEVAEPALTAEFVYFLCNVWSIRHWTVGRFEGALVRDELTRFVLRGLARKGRMRE